MTRREETEQILGNERLKEIFRIEPRIAQLLSWAGAMSNVRGYHRSRAYSNIKRKLLQRPHTLVGWGSIHAELSSQADYDLVLTSLDNLLPPDCDDLYPDGTYLPTDPDDPCSPQP